MAVSVVLPNILCSLTKILSNKFSHASRHALSTVRHDYPGFLIESGEHPMAVGLVLKESLLIKSLADAIHSQCRISECGQEIVQVCLPPPQ